MNYKDRQLLKKRISEIQTAKEEHARRLYVKDASGGRLHLGGGSRPENEQNRYGYPASQAEGNGARTERRGQLETKYTCGCDWNDPHIQNYTVTMLPGGGMTNKRFDSKGFEICPIHGQRIRGWASTGKNEPPIGVNLKSDSERELGHEDIPDRRDARDPEEVGAAYLARNGHHAALEGPRTMVAEVEPDTGDPSV